MSVIESVIDIPAEYMGNIFGSFDANIKKIEKTLKVTIVLRGDALKIIGGEAAVNSAASVFERLIELAKRGNIITEQTVDYTLSLSMEGKEDAITEIDKDVVARTATGKPIKPKTLGQIILTRPAIEAGEKLGFLPGDLQSKIDPYLRPLYDALYQIMGAESFIHNQEKGLIEVAPLAYMRGRTLDNAFIILDEAQNTTPAQMKMFLTRIGFGSKVIVTGDRTQKDLPKDVTSGLDVALKVLKDIDEIAVCRLSSKDVVRHPLVQKIVNAYDEYDKKAESKKQVRAQIKVKDRRNDH